MLALIAIWALAEATLFFIVADVPIMALGVKSGVKQALIGACVAAVFAAIGGSILYTYSIYNWKEVWEIMLSVPGIDEELTREVLRAWDEQGPLAMVWGSFSGVPYKLYAWAAADAWSHWIWLPAFFLASILARLPRFILVAVVAGWIGPRMIERFGKRRVWIAFVLGWSGFYALYWSAVGL